MNSVTQNAVEKAKRRTLSEGVHIMLAKEGEGFWFDGRTGARTSPDSPSWAYRVPSNATYNPYKKNRKTGGIGVHRTPKSTTPPPVKEGEKIDQKFYKIPEQGQASSGYSGSPVGGGDLSSVGSYIDRNRKPQQGVVNKIISRINEIKYKYSPSRNIKEVRNKIYTPKTMWQKYVDLENKHYRTQDLSRKEDLLRTRAENYEGASKDYERYEQHEREQYGRMASSLSKLADDIHREKKKLLKLAEPSTKEIEKLVGQLFDEGYFDEILNEDIDQMIKDKGIDKPKDDFATYHIEANNGSDKKSS